MPFMPNHTKSILDYDVKIENLRPEATFFVPAETGKLWNIKLLRLPFMTHKTLVLNNARTREFGFGDFFDTTFGGYITEKY